MRILLVTPTCWDPAHARVRDALQRGLTACGDQVSAFPLRDGRGPAESHRRLELLLGARDWDVCHIQHFSRGLGYLGRTRLPDRLKLVLTHQGASFKFMEERAAFLRLARRADAVTCVSRQGLRELLALEPGLRGKACVISNGTACPAKAPAGVGARALRHFILCVGRLAAYKGIDLLLMAFSGMARDFPRLGLVICGPDQTGGRLARFAADLDLAGRVSFRGATRPSRIRELMRECLFLIQPSREENMPLALLEAMAEGKAVVAFDVGGVDEALQDGRTGLLVGPQDVSGLESAMRRLVGSPDLCRRLGRQARQRAHLFEWGRIVHRYRRLYLGLLPHHAPR